MKRFLAIVLSVFFAYNASAQFNVVTSSDTNTCLGAATQLNVDPAGGNYPYVFTWSPGTTLSCTNCQSPWATPLVPTTYYVKVEDATFPNPVVKYDSVTVYPVEVFLAANANRDTICAGDTTKLHATNEPADCGLNPYGCSGILTDYTIGASSLTNSGSSFPAPYGNRYNGSRHQFLYPAVELWAMGFGKGTITELGFNVLNKNSAKDFSDFTILMKCTNTTSLTTWEKDMETVLQPATYTVKTGWNMHKLDTPFYWDSLTNIIVEICFNNTAQLVNGNASTYYTYTPGYNSTMYYYSFTGASICVNTGPGIAWVYRPNTRFSFCKPSYDGMNLVWTPSSTLNYDTIQSPTAKPPQSLYYVVNVNNNGCEKEDTVKVTVLPQAKADFTYTINGSVVFFNDKSIGATIWEWDYGDGYTSTGPTGSHLYIYGGIYTVMLVATNAHGCPDTMVVTIDMSHLGIDNSNDNVGVFEVYPNPFQNNTEIVYALRQSAEVNLEVYDILGNRIQIIVNEKQNQGEYRQSFASGELGLSSGVYILKLVIDGTEVHTKRLVELR
ncbi:MAG: T9SS type A sorting domain-containing protein [Bacteroidetes bacterium]|nr:T9SS type A sorting domain-containing protein [Bacteroidota bacterium]